MKTKDNEKKNLRNKGSEKNYQMEISSDFMNNSDPTSLMGGLKTRDLVEYGEKVMMQRYGKPLKDKKEE